MADLHVTFQGIMVKLLVAEETRAAFALTVTSVDELDEVWEGAEAEPTGPGASRFSR